MQAYPILFKAFLLELGITAPYTNGGASTHVIKKIRTVVYFDHTEFRQQGTVKPMSRLVLSHGQNHVSHAVNIDHLDVPYRVIDAELGLTAIPRKNDGSRAESLGTESGCKTRFAFLTLNLIAGFG